jgi:hypothetical protein
LVLFFEVRFFRFFFFSVVRAGKGVHALSVDLQPPRPILCYFTIKGAQYSSGMLARARSSKFFSRPFLFPTRVSCVGFCIFMQIF